MSQTLMIVAGEHSGDVYGGGMARAVRARAGAGRFLRGRGAPPMHRKRRLTSRWAPTGHRPAGASGGSGSDSRDSSEVLGRLSRVSAALPSIRLVVPHFGPRPSYFPLVVRSMARNPDVHWLLFTDEPVPDAPPNLDVRLGAFEGLAKRIQAHFDFEISLQRPYKLCDFRPAFGEIFAEELAGHDFWGHSDHDVIFGRLRDRLPAAAVAANGPTPRTVRTSMHDIGSLCRCQPTRLKFCLSDGIWVLPSLIHPMWYARAVLTPDRDGVIACRSILP